VHEGKRSHLEELPNREPERDWRPGESDTTVAWVGSLLFLSTARSRDVATTTQAHASPSLCAGALPFLRRAYEFLCGASSNNSVYQT
jgi:hypothetical protein